MNATQPPQEMFRRFEEWQQYVGWDEQDVSRVRRAGELLNGDLHGLIDDFYKAIAANPGASSVLSGDPQQIQRLHGTLLEWLRDFFRAEYDEAYVSRRWRVGWRHVEIRLDPDYVHLAMTRLRKRLLERLEDRWPDSRDVLSETNRAVNAALDLDLAIIQNAYAAENIRRQSEAARQRGEAAFQKLVEAAGSMIVILRSDHRIVYINPYGEHLVGREAGEMNGKDFGELFLVDQDRQRIADEVGRVMSGVPARGYESAVHCHDGATRWMVWNAQRLDDFDGEPALLAIGQDITSRKQAEERALQAERLAAIGQTITGLAHESRNALQRSQACVELLEMELVDRPAELELLTRMRRALEQLRRLYEEVRDYAAPIKLDKQWCELAHLWRDAWAHLEVNRDGREFELVERIGDVDLQCHVDWFAIGQVFRNILENSIAACPNPGRIAVAAHKTTIGDMPAIKISFTDNGPGIDPEIRDQVFQPFFTTKTKGTGLGMAIARRIVEAHGGRIELGAPARGAEFIISLPNGG